MVRSSVRPADVVIRLATEYGVPGVPPDSHTVAEVALYVSEFLTRPADTVITDAVIDSPSASQSDQSQRQSKIASGSFSQSVIVAMRTEYRDGMAQTIYRDEIPVDDRWHDVPLGQLVSVGPDPVRNDVVHVWHLVDPDDPPKATGRFRVFGTGHVLPENTRRANILGTVRTADGQYVWHLVSTWYPGNE